MHGRTVSRQRAQVHNRDRTSRWTDNIPGDGYIIAVNPAVLSGAGIDAGALACATCLGAGIMTICMGIFANRPLACASGLGVNAMIAGITTTVCGGDWHVAMSVIFLEGVVILLLVLCGLREAIMDAIPVVLRHAISVGPGLFIAMIGLCDAGIITAGAGTLVGLGDITSPPSSSASSPSW